MIKEELIHYLWLTKNFDHTNLKTSRGKPIHIKSYGQLNYSDGPDFLEAQILIDDILWSGAVEIHVKSSDWRKHQHEKDKKYDKVILHVVYHHDSEISHSIKEIIPCLELKRRIPHDLISLYQAFNQQNWIPCTNLIAQAEDIAIASAKEKAITHRLERWLHQTEISDNETEKNREELFYRLLLRAFGLKQNAEAFLEIAKKIPFKIVKKNSHSLHLLEALFFGMSGLLVGEMKDDYSNNLKKDYTYLSKKYHLTNSIKIPLNFKTVRPNNFPTIRLSQFSSLMLKPKIISELMCADKKGIFQLLDVKTSSYWDTHYMFNKSSNFKVKNFGSHIKTTIVVNAVVPIFYFFGKKNCDDFQLEKAYKLLTDLPSENNSTIKNWKNLGLHCANAYDSQSLLELKNYSCDNHACLKCPIGHDILKNG